MVVKEILSFMTIFFDVIYNNIFCINETVKTVPYAQHIIFIKHRGGRKKQPLKHISTAVKNYIIILFTFLKIKEIISRLYKA